MFTIHQDPPMLARPAVMRSKSDSITLPSIRSLPLGLATPPRFTMPPLTPAPRALASIPGPAEWIGPYPTAYTQHDPVHPSNKDGGPAAQAKLAAKPLDKRSGQPSVNPWDYLYDPNATPVKEQRTPEKHRQNFRHWQIEIMEVLFGFQPTPSRFEKQRLGAWLGVKSNRITIWFQNRRQDLSRRQKALASSPISPPDEPTVPPPPGRTNLGNWDPNSGKWRTVPTSCIGALAPPTPDREAVVRAIVTGELNRDDYIRHNPDWLRNHPSIGERRGDEGLVHVPPLKSRMEDIMAARDAEAGVRQYRRVSDTAQWEGDNDALLQLLPSDPPSMGIEDHDAPHEDDEPETPVRPRHRIGRELAPLSVLTANRPKLGRATSFDVLASSARAKQLSSFKAPEPPAKRARLDMSIPRGGRASIKTKPRASFSRDSPPPYGSPYSTPSSSSTLRTPMDARHDDDMFAPRPAKGEVMDAARNLLAIFGAQ